MLIYKVRKEELQLPAIQCQDACQRLMTSPPQEQATKTSIVSEVRIYVQLRSVWLILAYD